MKIAFINEGLAGSTGSIMLNLASEAKKNGHDVCVVAGTGTDLRPDNIDIFFTNNTFLKKVFSRFSDLNGSDGFCNPIMTKLAIRFIAKHKPDIINLHNSHDHYLDTAQVIGYANKHSIPIVWTLHDSWVVSGHCCYFEEWHCDKYKTGCGKCPCRWKDSYRRSILGDFSNHFWLKKRKLINGNRLISFVSPSKYVANIVRCGGYTNDLMVINNGIDMSAFKPSKPISGITKAAEGRHIILAGSSVWNESKGLFLLSKLAEDLDPKTYFIVAVGIPNNVKVSKRIYRIPYIDGKNEMASFYSSGDIFVNLTLQDNFPTVNLESIACGTPVFTFSSGGSGEMIKEGKNGFAVPSGDLLGMESLITRYFAGPQISETDCLATSLSFSKHSFAQKYLNLFSEKVLSCF